MPSRDLGRLSVSLADSFSVLLSRLWALCSSQTRLHIRFFSLLCLTQRHERPHAFSLPPLPFSLSPSLATSLSRSVSLSLSFSCLSYLSLRQPRSAKAPQRFCAYVLLLDYFPIALQSYRIPLFRKRTNRLLPPSRPTKELPPQPFACQCDV